MEADNPTSVALLNAQENASASIVVRLIKAPIADDADNVSWGQMIECDFPGYDPIRSIDFDITTEPSVAIGEILSTALEFVATDIVESQSVFGVAVLFEVAGQPKKFIHLHWFAEPFIFSFPGQTFKFAVRMESFNEVA